MTTTTTVHVQGMTCQHCVRAVTDEVSKLPGVQAVRVDLASGNVEIDADADALDPVALATAVDEAGYELTS